MHACGTSICVSMNTYSCMYLDMFISRSMYKYMSVSVCLWMCLNAACTRVGKLSAIYLEVAGGMACSHSVVSLSEFTHKDVTGKVEEGPRWRQVYRVCAGQA